MPWTPAEAPTRVLLVEDSAFFRDMLTPQLIGRGLPGDRRWTAADKALGLSEAASRFDLIISDIEMPGMNGFEFCGSAVRGAARWRKMPIIALSSHATPEGH